MKLSVCGKGGSGKSTVTALLAKHAVNRNQRVLVIDSDDSNTGLSRMLGFECPPVPLMSLVGGKSKIKEKMGPGSRLFSEVQIRIKDIPPEYMVQQNGLMQVGIGKILQALEGCACPMGVLSREFLKKLLLEEGEMAIADMEAGVEHFGRGVVESVDAVLIVVEPSYDSLMMAAKIKDLVAAMKKGVVAALNKTPSEPVRVKMKKELASRSIDVIGSIPNDPLVTEACWEGAVPDRGEAFDAAGTILDALLKSHGNQAAKRG